MQWLLNLKVGRRLGLAFAVVVAMALGLGALTVNRMAELNQALELVGKDRLPKIRALYEFGDHMDATVREGRNILLLDDPAKVRAAMELMVASRQKMRAALKQLDATLQRPEARKLLGEATTGFDAWDAAITRLIALRQEGRLADAKAHLYGDVVVKRDSVITPMDGLSAFQQQLVDDSIAAGNASYVFARTLTVVLLTLMAAFAAAVAWWIARSIARPLSEAVAVTEAVAAGDLTMRVQATSRDEVGQLMGALGRMVEQLARIVGGVRTGTEQIGTASSQIATGNQDLSSRTEEQASNLQQTAASMEQLAATVKNNTDAARQASQMAASASEVAERGGQVVARVVHTMGEIQGSSQRVSEIIGVIDGIAFQTNILALNAAVEAARAGEQGRGFAVVAGEVRNLAQRSAQAAKEIKDLIADSVGKVDSGSAQVREAGETMQQIVDQVKRVTDLIGEITSSTIEQASGINQVNEAVTQLDQVTQQNAALVEQSAAAADSMREQAARLAEAVQIFRIDRGTGEQAAQVIRRAAAPRAVARPVGVRAGVKSAVSAAARPSASARPAPAAAAPAVVAKPVAAGGKDDWEEF